MDRKRGEEYKSAVITFLIASVLLYLGLFMPVIFLAVPFILVYSVVRCGYALGGAAAVLSFAAIGYFDLKAALLLAAAFLPVAFTAGYIIREKKRFRNSIIASCAALFAGTAIVIILITVFTGKPVIDYIVDYTGSSLRLLGDGEIKSLYQVVRYPDILTGAVTQEAVNSASPDKAITIIQQMIRDVLNLWFVSIVGIYCLLWGLLCYVIPRAYAKKRKVDVASVPAFSEYALPKRFWLAFLVSYLFALAGESFGWRSFDVLELTIYNIYAFIFTVQALSFLDFIYRKRNMGAGARGMLHVLITLILSFILVWVGIFENIAGLRRRMDERQV